MIELEGDNFFNAIDRELRAWFSCVRRVSDERAFRPAPLQFDLAAHVFLDTDEVSALFDVVPHRGDRQFIPEGAAILAVVAQHFAARAAFGQRLANAGAAKLVAVVGLQEAAILIKDFVTAIAGQAFEGGIHVDEDGVVAFLFGDHDPVIGCIDHGLQ